ncbi:MULTISPECIES: putative T7SS-secreted protein [unclassified Streptomyces]|uniref:putative T7SS-secreted protein n=1 Tax=unclassified Streptomyces TaxID=2593676 RepID=UPI002E170253
MFIEDDGGWPGVGFNPAKGDTEAVDHLARDVAAVGRELEELEELLTSVGKDDGWWRGDAANKFREKLGSLPKYLQQGSDSMQACSSALHRYHGYLTEMQSHAQSVEAEAIPARKDADAKRRRRVDLADQYAGRVFEVDEVERIQRTIDDAAAAESAATDKLNSLIREAEDIHAKWKDRAGEAERAILKASENHPPDLSVWSRVADGLKEAWGGLQGLPRRPRGSAVDHFCGARRSRVGGECRPGRRAGGVGPVGRSLRSLRGGRDGRALDGQRSG